MSKKRRLLVSPGDPENPLYHHCMPAPGVTNDTITADRSRSDPLFLPAYDWVEAQLGFFPLFLAVGGWDKIAWMTGYQDNWRVSTGSECVDGKYRKTYRRKGEFPNLALLSFDHIDGVFMDYDYWHIALNACMNASRVSTREEQWIFKPLWTKTRWLRAALTGTHRVQLVTQNLPISSVRKIRVRNLATRSLLEERGFNDVQVFRIQVNP